MKTKHLFLATALMASFAACTNEEIVFDAPQNVIKDRPTVDNVELDFIGGVDSRVTYGANGYAWQATDTIGALLMDKVNTLTENNTWLQKYTLDQYIHTSYPFTYNNGVWSSNAKMLEGNYFFAYPWASYDGNRQVMHTLTAQEQNGIGTNVVAEAYGKNQFFIGYSQIMAGVDAKDALNEVSMTPILGAIQLRIVNTGTQVRHINKIVLKGDKLASTLTINPTIAEYGEYNLENANSILTSPTGHWGSFFNYANYTENIDDLVAYGNEKKVYSADEDYDRNEALRAIVKTVTGETFAQLTVNGTAAERELKANAANTAYALIMANPIEVTANSNDLKLDIYTDEGVLMNVNLTKVNETEGNYLALTDVAVKEIAPNVANTIKVQVDDNSFVIPQTMSIYTSEDLKQLIQWNARVAGARTITANLAKPVTLNKEMIDLLNASKHTLNIASTTEVLTLAADVPANALDAENLNITAPIKVLGTIAVTKDTRSGSITIAKGATLTTNDAKLTSLSATNEGTLTIGANAAITSGTITNKGTMTVAKGADVKATTANYGALNNNGYVQNVANKKDATITMGEGAILMTSTNEAEGTIITANNAQVSLSANNGEVKYVAGAIVSATGVISVEHTGALTKDTYKAETTGCAITKLIVKQGITSVVATDLAKFTEVEVLNGAELNVTTGTMSAGTLTIEGTATIKGKLNIDALDVEEEGELTIVKDAEITLTANSINNEGIVYNNGKVTAPADFTADVVTGEGTWKYNSIVAATATPEVDEEAVAAKLAALWPAVVEYMDLSYTGYEGKYMDKDDYTVVEASVEAWFDAIVTGGALTTAGKPAWVAAGYEDAVAFLENYTKDATNGYITADELTNALAEIKTANKAAAIKAIEVTTFVNDAKLYATQAAAYTVFKNNASKAVVVGNVANTDNNYSVWYAVNGLTDAEIEAALAIKNPNMYIWDDCVLEKVVAVWKDYASVTVMDGSNPVGGYTEAIAAGSGYATKLQTWLNAVYAGKAGDYEEIYDELVEAGYGLKNKDSFGGYSDDQMKAVSTGLLNELELALQNASGTLVLTKDYEISTPLLVNKDITIDLNGKKIKSAINLTGHKAVILATAGTVTIKGDGEIQGLTPGTNDISTPAVWAKGTATVKIQGGKFSTKGKNSCIYVSSSEAKVEISAGEFSSPDDPEFVLNQNNAVKKQRIFVSGGKFYAYNPADGDDATAQQGTPASFLAEGYKSVKVTGSSNDWTVVAE